MQTLPETIPEGSTQHSDFYINVIHHAEDTRHLANQLSDIRARVSPALGATLALRGPSWALSAATAVVASTDWFDGRLSRDAAQMLGEPTTLEGSEKDHKADKKFYYSLTGGMIASELREGRILDATLITVNAVATVVRDKKMRQARDEAQELGQDTKAIPINKYKTVIQMGALLLGTSPLVEKPGWRRLRNISFTAGTALGIVGYKKFKRSLQAKNALVDTTQVHAAAAR